MRGLEFILTEGILKFFQFLGQTLQFGFSRRNVLFSGTGQSKLIIGLGLIGAGRSRVKLAFYIIEGFITD